MAVLILFHEVVRKRENITDRGERIFSQWPLTPGFGWEHHILTSGWKHTITSGFTLPWRSHSSWRTKENLRVSGVTDEHVDFECSDVAEESSRRDVIKDCGPRKAVENLSSEIALISRTFFEPLHVWTDGVSTFNTCTRSEWTYNRQWNDYIIIKCYGGRTSLSVLTYITHTLLTCVSHRKATKWTSCAGLMSLTPL